MSSDHHISSGDDQFESELDHRELLGTGLRLRVSPPRSRNSVEPYSQDLSTPTSLATPERIFFHGSPLMLTPARSEDPSILPSPRNNNNNNNNNINNNNNNNNTPSYPHPPPAFFGLDGVELSPSYLNLNGVQGSPSSASITISPSLTGICSLRPLFSSEVRFSTAVLPDAELLHQVECHLGLHPDEDPIAAIPVSPELLQTDRSDQDPSSSSQQDPSSNGEPTMPSVGTPSLRGQSLASLPPAVAGQIQAVREETLARLIIILLVRGLHITGSSTHRTEILGTNAGQVCVICDLLLPATLFFSLCFFSD